MNLADILDDWPLWGISKKPIEAHQIKVLVGGLTNTCYQLSLDSGEYIIRISADNTQALGIDRHVEKTIHQWMSRLNFTSAIRYCDDENRYWIRDYIEGEVLSDNVAAMSQNTLAYLIEQLKALHQIPVELELPVINISEKAEAYWQILETRQPHNEIIKMKPLMQVAMSEPPVGKFCLCHLDPVLTNWLYTAEGLQLLDWEYAGLGHPLWDVAALFQGIKQAIKQLNSPFGGEKSKDSQPEIEKDLEENILTLYGVSDLAAWRRACIQMEYLSSLWYQAQEKIA